MSRGRIVGVGLVWAAALWVKPTLFAQTGIFYVGVLGLSCLREWWTEPALRKTLCLKSLGIAAIAGLAAFPHLGLELPYFIHYMWVNTFGGSRDLWTLKIPLSSHLLYYFLGFGGSFTLGKGAWYMAGIIAATLTLAWWQRRENCCTSSSPCCAACSSAGCPRR